MESLIIKWDDNVKPADNIQVLIINKLDVSAIYSESNPSNNTKVGPSGTLVLAMKSGKEFKFKYAADLTASVACVNLCLAIRFESADEITI